MDIQYLVCESLGVETVTAFQTIEKDPLYHRFGKEYCLSHTVREEDLDCLLHAELLRAKGEYAGLWLAMEQKISQWTPNDGAARAQIQACGQKIKALEEELEVILMERIRDKENEERYNRTTPKREAQIAQLKTQITELENISTVLRQRQAKLKKDISLMDDILSDSQMTEAQLRLLIERILVHEEEGQISLEFRIKAPFREHTEQDPEGLDLDRIEALLKEA